MIHKEYWIESIVHAINKDYWQIDQAIKLFREDCTIPFIARYRKDKTGALDEKDLRVIFDSMTKHDKLENRKKEIKQSLENQNELNDRLTELIDSCLSLKELEEIYLPYKKKQKTRASIAIEMGLKPLNEFLLNAKAKNDHFIDRFVKSNDKLKSRAEAIQKALDIFAEDLSCNSSVRSFIRENLNRHGLLICSKKEDADDKKEVFKPYYDFQSKINLLPEWKVLAINRAEKLEVIRCKLNFYWDYFNTFLYKRTGFKELEGVLYQLLYIYGIYRNNPYLPEIYESAKDAYKRLLFPSIEREIRADLSEKAELRSIEIFQNNLRHLILSPPLTKKKILGIDPGFKSGCKIALIDENGTVITCDTIYPTPPHLKVKESINLLKSHINKYHVNLIAIGNGTASKETEEFVNLLIKEVDDKDLKYVIVSEAGASVYSASEAAQKEFPEYDVSLRGAISIGRRIQDMLNELVKIPPESIGVGMYQHDIPITLLKEKLGLEVESAVNYIGVDINTASEYLLQYVSGFSNNIARNVVNYRIQNGGFTSRKDLLKVKGLGNKTFELCAGFCRVLESENIFDQTIIHPESYLIADRLLKILNIEKKNLNEIKIQLDPMLKSLNYEYLAEQLKTSQDLIKDIVDALVFRKIDPRNEYPQANFKEGIRSISDLFIGFKTRGTVRNVTDFGIFIDINVGYDGLVYRSSFMQYNPLLFAPGMMLNVEVINMDQENKKIGLKIIKDNLE